MFNICHMITFMIINVKRLSMSYDYIYNYKCQTFKYVI